LTRGVCALRCCLSGSSAFHLAQTLKKEEEKEATAQKKKTKKLSKNSVKNLMPAHATCLLLHTSNVGQKEEEVVVTVEVDPFKVCVWVQPENKLRRVMVVMVVAEIELGVVLVGEE
jgi:hypothetical protein